MNPNDDGSLQKEIDTEMSWMLSDDSNFAPLLFDLMADQSFRDLIRQLGQNQLTPVLLGSRRVPKLPGVAELGQQIGVMIDTLALKLASSACGAL